MTSKSTTIAAYTHQNPRNPRGECGCAQPHVGLEFYVTVKDGPRTGWLLGPYGTHEEALDNMDRGSKLAGPADRWSHFYAYGTTGIMVGAGVRTVFGS